MAGEYGPAVWEQGQGGLFNDKGWGRIHPIKKHHVAGFVVASQSDPKYVTTQATQHPLRDGGRGEEGRGEGEEGRGEGEEGRGEGEEGRGEGEEGRGEGEEGRGEGEEEGRGEGGEGKDSKLLKICFPTCLQLIFINQLSHLSGSKHSLHLLQES